MEQREEGSSEIEKRTAATYKMAKINALASKLAGRYFYHFTWLVD